MTDNFLNFVCERRSVRKFDESPVTKDDIRYFIDAACAAPSACNSQCWKFTAVMNSDVKLEMAKAVEDAIRLFFKGSEFENDEEFIAKRIKACTFFKNAPAVILVYLDDMPYYEKKTESVYKNSGLSNREMLDTMGYPDILSVGAAVQNMLLAIHERGFGACWMNDPVIAEANFKNIKELNCNLKLLSIVPIGVSAYKPWPKNLKPSNDVLTVIE